MNQMEVFKETLKSFCDRSEHNVNASKMQIYFSKNTNPVIWTDIVNGFNFMEVQSWYLGIPLLHHKISKATYGYVIDKEIPPVKWEDMKERIDRGGLGFRDLTKYNMTFLMKVKYQLITEDNKLWVRVMRAKYKWKGLIPLNLSASGCLRLWYGVRNVCDTVRKGLVWCVQDRCFDRFLV
ncbi:hypothetical protein V6N12_059659 [Hibiscus sabdariffa]|uniref:Reverse transcriptase n=1 Tax=Hibiscus sabdariffa TaxID=183260 RepID=A0ABR2EVQ1_9ROSI